MFYGISFIGCMPESRNLAHSHIKITSVSDLGDSRASSCNMQIDMWSHFDVEILLFQVQYLLYCIIELESR